MPSTDSAPASVWTPSIAWVDPPEAAAGADALVLVPSLGTSSAMFDTLVQSLHDGGSALTPIRVDLPGHGSGPTRSRVTVAGIARDVDEGIRRSGARSVIVLGVSLGGAVALEVAGLGAPSVRGFVMINSGVRFGDPAGWSRLIQAVEQLGTAGLRPGSARGWFSDDFAESVSARAVIEAIDDIDPATYIACCRALDEYRGPRDAGAISTPGLLIGTTDDMATSAAALRSLSSLLPHAEYRELSTGRHLSLIEHSEAVSALVSEWAGARSLPRDFPEDFLWGTATAAHQVEGDNHNSDWWKYEHAAGSAARESSGDAIDHFHRYAEDFALLAGMGHTAHRLSIEWARIEPAPGEFSRSAISHYRSVLKALRATGMHSFVTLHHFTLPVWFADRGGWLAHDALAHFERYCLRVTRELGDLVDFFCTINEPQMVALHGYLEGYFPPGETNPTLWKRVGRALLDAHKVAVRAVRAESDASPGLVVQLPVLAAARDDDASRVFLDALRGEIVDLHLDGIAGDPDAGDWVGVQYYRKNWVDHASPTLFGAPPAGTSLTQMGWAVYPEGLREVLHRAAKVGLPLYVTENGIATENDAERIDYLESHLGAVAQARAEGIDVRGYIHWSAFDNFEWAEGYGPKFGLIAVDREDDFRRVPKLSAAAYSRVIRTGAIAALRQDSTEG